MPVYVIDPGALMRRARHLHRRGELTHAMFVMFEALMWTCRRPGATTARASYTGLRRAAGVSRDTVARAVKRLAAVRLLTIDRRRLRVRWGTSIASRQDVSVYVFPAQRTESDDRPVLRETDSIPCVENAAVVAAQAALDRVLARKPVGNPSGRENQLETRQGRR